MSSSRPTPLGPCRHSLFQAFGYWSAVRSRRAGKKKNKEDERAVTPNHTPSLFFCCCCCCCCFLSAHISFPTKKKYTVSQPVNSYWVSLKEIDCRTGANIFFLRFLRHHCEADLERETRAMHGEQVLQAIKISNEASLFLFLFRCLYFLKIRSKIRDSMLR